MMDGEKIDTAIRQLNQRLKAARLGLAVERRGDRLGLRGTLPPVLAAIAIGPISSAYPWACPPPRLALSKLNRKPR
ncbi:MAG: hypothetical protein LVS60_03980 [Nodosilinea sp. LVE1205-7]|jgi:hypothetical protein